MNKNIENAWANMNEAMGIKNNQPSINNMKKQYAQNQLKELTNANKAIVDPINHFFTLKNTPDDSHGAPGEEMHKVTKFVKDIFFTMYPEKEGDIYPSNWTVPVIDYYKRIRTARAKVLKTTKQDSMKGLRLHVVVACILRCVMIKDNVGIPMPTLLRFMNEALRRSQEKKERAPIPIELFERYRTDSKMGIRNMLKKEIPTCLNNLQPENLIDFTAYSLLRFRREEVLATRRLVRHSWNDGDGSFADTTSPSIVAIAALFTMCVLLNKEFDYALFGVTKQKLLLGYNAIIGSSDPRVIREINKLGLSNVPSMTAVSDRLTIPRTPPCVTKNKKRASVKM